MSRFLSGDDLLQAARLLREGLPGRHAVLVVEGPSDKNFFRDFCLTPRQILVAGGKTKLMDAHDLMRPQDQGTIVLVADRDGEKMPRSDNLIVSEANDLDADLLAHGLLARVLPELLTSASEFDREQVERLAEQIRLRAVEFATPLGRVRRAARKAGISLRVLNETRHQIDFSSFCNEDGRVEFERAFGEVARVGRLANPQQRRILDEVDHSENGEVICNGHDLVCAVAAVMRLEHRVAKRKVETLESLLRVAATPIACAGLAVVEDLRRWQERTDAQLLLPLPGRREPPTAGVTLDV